MTYHCLKYILIKDYKQIGGTKKRLYPPNLDAIGLQQLLDGTLTHFNLFYKPQNQDSLWKESNKRIKIKETYELYTSIKTHRETKPEYKSSYFNDLERQFINECIQILTIPN